MMQQLYRYSNRVKKNDIDALIVCVGNLTCGGSGKTPAAIMIAKLVKEYIFFNNEENKYQIFGDITDVNRDFLGKIIKKINNKSQSRNIKKRENKIKIAFLSKGYKSNNDVNYELVNQNNYQFLKHGDEIGELVEYNDVIFVKKRSDIVKVNNNEYDIIIMDDGLFDSSLEHDLDVIIIDEKYRLGNELSLPFGPIRNLKVMIRLIFSKIFNIKYYDILFYIRSSKQLNCDNFKLKIANNSYIIDIKYLPIQVDLNYVAFSGLGINQKFFSTLKESGINLVEKIEFPDHYQYNQNDINKLIAIKNKYQNCFLITTKKDFNRIKNIALIDEVKIFLINFEISCKL